MSTILETILAAAEVVKHVSGAIEVMDKLKRSILNLRGRRADELDERSPLGTLVYGHEEELRRLISNYTDVARREDADEIEKDKERRRIAARACRLLQSLDGVLDRYIEDFEELKTFFCERVPQS